MLCNQAAGIGGVVSMTEYIERDMVLSHKWEVRSYDPSDPDPVTEVVSVSSIMRVPAADVVELPCRIGDTVWCIRSFRGIDHPQETKVSGMYFTQDMRLNIQCKYVGIGEFGKKVFKTREDAMKAMEGQRA